MRTLRFEDREWLKESFVTDENGRLTRREEYDTLQEFREVLRNHNYTHRTQRAREIITLTLIGGMMWGAITVLNSIL